MRMSDRANSATNSANIFLHAEWKDTSITERSFPAMELASEYGVHIPDVKNVKKHIERS